MLLRKTWLLERLWGLSDALDMAEKFKLSNVIMEMDS
jgi:hypothetical protein